MSCEVVTLDNGDQRLGIHSRHQLQACLEMPVPVFLGQSPTVPRLDNIGWFYF